MDISLTGTDYCNSRFSNKKYIHLLFLIFWKNLRESHNPNLLFWKDFAFALKVVLRKLLW